MDTTTSTIAGADVLQNAYVSCIKVDGKPILPPLMSDERREEMRMYREQAILRERQLQDKRRDRFNSTTKTLQNRRSLSTSPTPGVPATSTPRVSRIRTRGLNETTFSSNPVNSKNTSGTLFNSSNVPEGVLRERKDIISNLDLSRTLSSNHSVGSSAMSYDGDEEKCEISSTGGSARDSDNGSGDNFASAASSAGTFVIRRNDTDNSRKTDFSSGRHDLSDKGNTSEDDQRDGENAPPTVVRKTLNEEPMFKRKRPAKYFDLDECGEAESAERFRSATVDSTYSNLPHSVPESRTQSQSNQGTPCPLSFSPVPLTNFTSIAKNLTNEFTKKVSSILPTSSPSSEAHERKSTGGSYDVRLTTNIPSSAEEMKQTDSDSLSNGSDKENVDTTLEKSSTSNKSHVRKLSYTLATPSAVLLEAVSKSKAMPQTLETVYSVAGSVGAPSGNPTPERPNYTRHIDSANLSPYQESQGTRPELLSASLASLNLGKQAHLERFLVDQKNRTNQTPATNTSSLAESHEVSSLLKKMHQEHQNKLAELAEQHRKQQLRMKEDLENEFLKLKEKLGSTLNTSSSTKSYKVSPNSLLDSLNSSARSPRPPATSSREGSTLFSTGEVTANTIYTDKSSSSKLPSGLSGITTDQTGQSPVFHFSGTATNNFSAMPNPLLTGATELATVGLSKLQSRFQMMSPKLLRVPVDGRSPLLKGLVFPDPLDKPQPPIRLPPKALEPSMKYKFDKISAAVKGHLTRRLLNTEKVQRIVQTIRDTVDLLLKLYEEAPAGGSTLSLMPQDSELHQRLIQQLTGACRSFHDVFFKLTTKERMAIIATDREKLKAKAMRSAISPGRPTVSNATLKSIERRMSHRHSPKRDGRKARPSKIHEPTGSQSVKPKAVKNFNISPKRRRISYWDEKNSFRRPSTSQATNQDFNGNRVKYGVNSARSQASVASNSSTHSVTTQRAATAGGISDTFIVPPASSRSQTGSSNYGITRPYITSVVGRRDSSANARSSISARSTQSSTSVNSGSGSRSRASLSRQAQPWNK